MFVLSAVTSCCGRSARPVPSAAGCEQRSGCALVRHTEKTHPKGLYHRPCVWFDSRNNPQTISVIHRCRKQVTNIDCWHKRRPVLFMGTISTHVKEPSAEWIPVKRQHASSEGEWVSGSCPSLQLRHFILKVQKSTQRRCGYKQTEKLSGAPPSGCLNRNYRFFIIGLQSSSPISNNAEERCANICFGLFCILCVCSHAASPIISRISSSDWQVTQASCLCQHINCAHIQQKQKRCPTRVAALQRRRSCKH